MKFQQKTFEIQLSFFWILWKFKKIKTGQTRFGIDWNMYPEVNVGILITKISENVDELVYKWKIEVPHKLQSFWEE